MTAVLRRAAFTCSVTALVLVLGGCAGATPQPRPEPAPAVAPPVLSVAQSESVLTQIGAVLAAGDAASDPAGLAARLTGPALAIRTAEYVRMAATGGAKPPTVLPMSAQTLIVPDTTSWPRIQMVVTEQPDDLQAPRILVLQQASARDPYRLWGWARLGPGVQMPATADPATGSAPIALDDSALVVSPVDTLAQYADVLASGDASPYAATFPADFFRTSIEARRAAYTEKVQAVGTVSESYTPVPDQVFALATVNGGAIVVGAMTTVTNVAVAQGSVALNDPFETALAGRDSVASALARTWSDVVAFYVPPKGGPSSQVQVLAVEHAITAVAGQ